MRQTISIMVGVIVTVLATFVLGSIVPTLESGMVRFFSLSLGGLVAGAVAGRLGWIIGGVVGLSDAILTIFILRSIALRVSGGQVGITPEMGAFSLLLSSILIGIGFGYLGETFQKKLRKTA